MREFVVTFWPHLVALLNLVCALIATVHILLKKRNTRAAIAWIGFAWLAPLLGVLLYFCFGVNRIQRRAISLKIRESWDSHTRPTLTEQEERHVREIAARHPNLVGLATVGNRLTDRPLQPGNAVEILENGDEAYPRMIEAIERAEHSVGLLSYIFDSGRAGDAFLEALVRAQRRGVEVRVLVDAVGSNYGKPNMVPRLQSAGVRAEAFLPTRTPRLFHYANLRNHRKILVVDGHIGFTGGTNIRDGHWLALEPDAPVQCVHFRIEGPVVAHLEEVFAIDWAFASGESIAGPDWFPKVERVGDIFARGLADGPDEDFERLSDVMLAAIASATNSLRIVTPYFLPETSLVRALNIAALRGIDVRIYLPERNNIPLVQWAGWAMFELLLEKGCRLFLTPSPFDHTKLMVMDNIWSLVGSTNWDPRSLRLNFEFNVECYDEHLASRLVELIDRKAENAREITLEQVHGRTLPIRLRDSLSRLATPYL